MIKFSFILSSAFLLFAPAVANASEVVLRMVYSVEKSYPNMMGQGPEIPNPPGIVIDIIKQTAKDIGVKIELRRLPDKRLFVHLKNGKADGNFSHSFSKDRMEFGVYPMKNGEPDSDKRTNTAQYYLYKSKGSSLQSTAESLTQNGTLIGAQLGFSIVNDLTALGAKVTEVESSESLFKMLETGRVNGIAIHDNEGDFYVKTNKLNQIEKVEPPLKTKHYYLMFSHQFVEKHPQIAEKFWNRIGEIREKVRQEKLPQYEALPR